MSERTKRPKYLNLIKIRLPVTGIVSILHRISGVLLFLTIPFLAYLLHLSTSNQAGFEQSQMVLQMPLVKIALLLLVWSLFHHLIAGIRYLLIDIDIGIDKVPARKSAFASLFAGIILAIITLGMLL